MIIDLFAGGGGASLGIEAATGRHVDVAINHSATALAVHAANHPRTKHLVTDIWEVDPRKVTRGRKVEMLWASPDCTHFSLAKGGKPVERGIRSLAWVVVEWARAVRPSVIFLENVSEFRTWGPLGADNKPDKTRMGETFQQWLGALSLLGYTVDYRVLDASLYGAPTKRRRLFLVARCDGQPIRWPEPTHGPGLLPVHTAAECIDWSLPCPSIFERKKPLAEATLRRIAAGIKTFVIESPTPFVFVAGVGGRAGQSAATGGRAPLGTITAKNDRVLVAPTLVQTGYGERKGQRPRFLDLHEPLGTIMGGGAKHALVGAFLVKHYGDPSRRSGGGVVVGSSLDRPIGTVTARDHHSLAEVTLGPPASHQAEVRAFLTKYYGTSTGQPLDVPLGTVTSNHHFGLVMVEGVEHAIADIGMRMLAPHELLRAQFGRFAEAYDMTAATTKAAKVRLVGNSVCPEVAEALVRANQPRAERRAA